MTWLRWLYSSRYRRLCRLRLERAERNIRRQERHLRERIERLAEEAHADGDYQGARQFRELLFKLAIASQLRGL